MYTIFDLSKTKHMESYIAYYESRITGMIFDNEIFSAKNAKEARYFAQKYKRQMGYGKLVTTIVKSHQK